MKKIFYSLLFLFVFSNAGTAQNFVQKILVLPARPVVSSLNRLVETGSEKVVYKINSIVVAADNSGSFISNLPAILLKEYPKRLPFLLFAELSLNDMLENSVNFVNASLLNTYDDQITELFKDAPSMVKLKCIITF